MLLALVCLSLQVQLPADLNGIWSDTAGNYFTLASPHLIWGVFGRRHYTAVDVSPSSEGRFAGKFEASRRLEVGRTGDSWKADQALSTAYPGPANPLMKAGNGNLPHVHPENASVDTGTIHLSVEPGRQIRMEWKTSQGAVAYSDTVYFRGKSDKVSLEGKFDDREVEIQMSEKPGRSKRDLDGVLRLDGKNYVLHGFRVWTRGMFALTSSDGVSFVGLGCIEWHPSKRFLNSMADSPPASADMVEVWFNPASGSDLTRFDKFLIRR